MRDRAMWGPLSSPEVWSPRSLPQKSWTPSNFQDFLYARLFRLTSSSSCILQFVRPFLTPSSAWAANLNSHSHWFWEQKMFDLSRGWTTSPLETSGWTRKAHLVQSVWTFAQLPVPLPRIWVPRTFSGTHGHRTLYSTEVLKNKIYLWPPPSTFWTCF